VEKIETKLAEDHLARADSPADAIRCAGLFCLELVVMT